jgi:hypothetical protein
MDSVVWFLKTGIHDPAWVQAVASSALLILTLVTLAVLAFYAWDTHTLAKTSVDQISLIKQEREILAMRNYHVAYDCFFKVQADLNAIMQSLADCTFGTKPQAQIYPENWPDVTSALNQRVPSTMQPAIALGIKLRHVDFTTREFLNASNNDDRGACEANVKKALFDAGEECKKLWHALPETQK